MYNKTGWTLHISFDDRWFNARCARLSRKQVQIDTTGEGLFFLCKITNDDAFLSVSPQTPKNIVWVQIINLLVDIARPIVNISKMLLRNSNRRFLTSANGEELFDKILVGFDFWIASGI